MQSEEVEVEMDDALKKQRELLLITKLRPGWSSFNTPANSATPGLT